AHHLFEGHGIEQPGDRGLDRPDRLADAASVKLGALEAGEAPHDPERPFDGPQDVTHLDLTRLPREDVTTLWSVEALDQLPFGESLEDLRQELARDTQVLGDPLGVDGRVVLMEGNVVDRHQAVVSPLAEA